MKFVQLPNGDLWRGRAAEAPQRPDTIDMTSTDNPGDVVAQMIQSQKGETLACVFCGQGFNRKQLNELLEHVETLHKSSVAPPTDAELMLVQQGLDAPEIVARIEAKPMGQN